MVTIYNTPLSTTSEKALFGRPGGGHVEQSVDALKLLPLRNFELHKRKRPTIVDLIFIWLLSINAAAGW